MWLAAAVTVVVLGLWPCLFAAARGEPVARLAGLLLAGPVATLVLALLAAGYGRPGYLDVVLVLALLSYAGTLVFARFLGRTL